MMRQKDIYKHIYYTQPHILHLGNEIGTPYRRKKKRRIAHRAIGASRSRICCARRAQQIGVAASVWRSHSGEPKSLFARGIVCGAERI